MEQVSDNRTKWINSHLKNAIHFTDYGIQRFFCEVVMISLLEFPNTNSLT